MTTRKIKLFKKRSLRVRNKLKKTSFGKFRLSIHRSSKNIYAQVIDDRIGTTVASVSSLEKSLGVVGKNNIEVATKLGKEIASRALKKGVKEVVFDRGGFLYHGKIKALADAARENGLKL
tara:strand:+ start:1630 stop:1989 length:360 start_codon:yes stop_codon:yes gene_type:complete